MYGKLFAQMYDGTLATKGPWEALVTFQQFIILADRHGVVDMTPEAISRRTTVPLPIIQAGINALEQPDQQSRSPDEDGRRIVPLDEHRPWGWRVVNYGHYRKIRSEEERREYHREYMRRKRSVNSDVKESTGGDQCQPIAVSSMQYAVSNKKEEAASSAATAASTVPSKKGLGKKPIGDWVPSDELVSKLQARYQKTPEQMQRHYTALRDYCLASGRKYADFDAAYRISVRDNWGYK